MAEPGVSGEESYSTAPSEAEEADTQGRGSVSTPPERCSLTEHCTSKALEQKRSALGGCKNMRDSEAQKKSPKEGFDNCLPGISGRDSCSES